MTYPLILMPGSRPAAEGVLVAVLHPRDEPQIAVRLVEAWRMAVPLATFAMLAAPQPLQGLDLDETAEHLRQLGANGTHLVLAGIGGAQFPALQLALAGQVPLCRGVLGCGTALMPHVSVPRGPANRGVKLRLVWEVQDPVACSVVMGALLSTVRAAGVEAQGSVLDCGGVNAPADDPASWTLSPAVIRMGRAYLAELVAVALGPCSADGIRELPPRMMVGSNRPGTSAF